MIKPIARILLLVVFAFSAGAQADNQINQHFESHEKGPRVLILFDNGGAYSHLGEEQAILMRNLLGHFKSRVKMLPVTKYKKGQMEKFNTTFYLGSTYQESSYYTEDSVEYENYQLFLADAATTERTLVWLNYNLWELAWNWQPEWGITGFSGKFGFEPVGTENNKYNRVNYKDTELYKGVILHANPGSTVAGCIDEGEMRLACSTEINKVTIIDPALASTVATAYSSLDPSVNATPYITHSNNFWFIGDIPFTFMSEEDRYLVFADVLHDILKIGLNQAPVKHALVRFEDVSPGTKIDEFEAVASYLEQNNVPFTVATVPHYQDPLGALSPNGEAISIKLPGSDIGRSLKRYYDAGLASIVQHGYSHQWDRIANPYDGVTANDYEFYRVTLNSDYSLNFEGPVAGDSGRWAKKRMKRGKRLLKRTGLKAIGWEAPHYMASHTDYRAIKRVYPLHYGRMAYFSKKAPTGRFVSQFFPYVIEKDYYGYRQIPESLGNVSITPLAGYQTVLPEHLINHARKLSVVRDGIASFYYHPFLGADLLAEVVEGLQMQGYEFIAACRLTKSCPVEPISTGSPDLDD